MSSFTLRNVQAISAIAVCLALNVTQSDADPIFYSTSEAARWQVATNVGGPDGLFSSFSTTGFVIATAVSGRNTDGIGWIANNSAGTNNVLTFFVFRQTFDLAGYNPNTANLRFQWAADDSGQGFANRGTWTPKYSLNGSSLTNGNWPPDGSSYAFGPMVNLSSGFVAGLNMIDFYVEGNGVTDGMALEANKFHGISSAVPEPSSLLMLFAGGVIGCGLFLRRRQPALLALRRGRVG